MTEEMFRRYRKLIVWGPFQPSDDDDLDRVERELGRSLPKEYREFLLVGNGGRMEYAVSLPPGEPGELVSFDDLMSVDRLVQGWRDHQPVAAAVGLPSELLPVARDGSGSQLYLDLRPTTYGQVLAFVHGLPAWAGGGDGDSFGVVTASWNDYLDQVSLEEDMAELQWQDACEEDGTNEGRAWREAVAAWLDAGMPDWRSREWAVPSNQPRRSVFGRLWRRVSGQVE